MKNLLILAAIIFGLSDAHAVTLCRRCDVPTEWQTIAPINGSKSHDTGMLADWGVRTNTQLFGYSEILGKGKCIVDGGQSVASPSINGTVCVCKVSWAKIGSCSIMESFPKWVILDNLGSAYQCQNNCANKCGECFLKGSQNDCLRYKLFEF